MRTGARRVGLGVAFLIATAAFAGCGSRQHPSHFTDDFDQGFPGDRWNVVGSAPVLDTTAGDAAPSLNWVLCSGSGGAAQIDRTFYGSASFAASFAFMIWGSADVPEASVALQMFGDSGDYMQAVIIPDGGGQPGLIEFDIDTPVAILPPPPDGGFHKIDFALDQYGDALWAVDGTPVADGFVVSTVFDADFLCTDRSAPTGPLPILLDDIDVQARPQP